MMCPATGAANSMKTQEIELGARVLASNSDTPHEFYRFETGQSDTVVSRKDAKHRQKVGYALRIKTKLEKNILTPLLPHAINDMSASVVSWLSSAFHPASTEC
jgi:hypothetical protein